MKMVYIIIFILTLVLLAINISASNSYNWVRPVSVAVGGGGTCTLDGTPAYLNYENVGNLSIYNQSTVYWMNDISFSYDGNDYASLEPFLGFYSGIWNSDFGDLVWGFQNNGDGGTMDFITGEENIGVNLLILYLPIFGEEPAPQPPFYIGAYYLPSEYDDWKIGLSGMFGEEDCIGETSWCEMYKNDNILTANDAGIDFTYNPDPLLTPYPGGTPAAYLNKELQWTVNGTGHVYSTNTFNYTGNTNYGIGEYSIPGTDGAANQVLTTDGNGVVSWQNTGAGEIPPINNLTNDYSDTLVFSRDNNHWDWYKGKNVNYTRLDTTEIDGFEGLYYDGKLILGDYNAIGNYLSISGNIYPNGSGTDYFLEVSTQVQALDNITGSKGALDFSHNVWLPDNSNMQGQNTGVKGYMSTFGNGSVKAYVNAAGFYEMNRREGEYTEYNDDYSASFEGWNRHMGNGTINLHLGAYAYVQTDTGATSNHVLGFKSYLNLGGTSSIAYNFWANKVHSTPKSLDTLGGLFIDNMEKGTLNYGVKIEPFTNSGGDDFEIYDGGRAYFAKDVYIGSTSTKMSNATITMNNTGNLYIDKDLNVNGDGHFDADVDIYGTLMVRGTAYDIAENYLTENLANSITCNDVTEHKYRYVPNPKYPKECLYECDNNNMILATTTYDCVRDCNNETKCIETCTKDAILADCETECNPSNESMDMKEYYSFTTNVCTVNPSYDFNELEGGDVVCKDDKNPRWIKKCTSAYDISVRGVISTEPAQVIGGEYGYPKVIEGIVPVKVICPVNINDPLVSSNTPGYAQAYSLQKVKDELREPQTLSTAIKDNYEVTFNNERAIFGYAEESCEKGTTQIMAWID